jgi:hypothetical protein
VKREAAIIARIKLKRKNMRNTVKENIELSKVICTRKQNENDHLIVDFWGRFFYGGEKS